MILSDTGFIVITTTDCFLLSLNKRAVRYTDLRCGGLGKFCNFFADKILWRS